MSKPVVAIVGRPNVGKSTLFNKLIGQRLSIVDDTPGVTRDRIYGDCEWLGHTMLLVDTGGIEPYSDDIILSQMRRQAQLAIDSAEVIILVTDVRDGVVATDLEVAAMLQKSGKPVVLCVNKCDAVGELPADFYEFYNLGLGDPIAVSSVHGRGTGDLLDAVLQTVAGDPEIDAGDLTVFDGGADVPVREAGGELGGEAAAADGDVRREGVDRGVDGEGAGGREAAVVGDDEAAQAGDEPVRAGARRRRPRTEGGVARHGTAEAGEAGGRRWSRLSARARAQRGRGRAAARCRHRPTEAPPLPLRSRSARRCCWSGNLQGVGCRFLAYSLNIF